MTTYERPVEAELHVHLANGETWKATPEDLKRFGLIRSLDAYAAFDKKLIEALESFDYNDITDAQLNPLRYLVEVVLCYPEHFDEYPDSMADLLGEVRQLEELLAHKNNA